MVKSIIGSLALAVLVGTTASCSYIERELIFHPQTADWSGYSPAILDEEKVWIPVGSSGERLQGWWLASPGARHTLVFFHGANVNLSGSVYRLRSFRDAGYNVFAIDYRGFGKSSGRMPSEQSVYEDAEAAWKWLDSRVPDRRKRILWGHSLGAVVAAEIALRGGGAAALVIESAFTSIPDMTVLGDLVKTRMDLRDKLSRLDVPVVVVHGAADNKVPPEMARQLYDAARGPKRLVMVEGASHRLVVLRAGDAIYGALRELTVAQR
jgi:alpha-beta hydrolase superfamily lysophospholipase